VKGRVNIERLALVLIAAVALAGFVVSPALGGPGFLTQKEANKLYLKKKAASRLYLASADAESRFLSRSDADTRFAPRGEAYSRAEADARFLRREGATRITATPSLWRSAPIFGGPEPTVDLFADGFKLTTAEQGVTSAYLTPQLPTTLYGKATKLLGVEYCYSAGANAKLAGTFLELLSQTSGPDVPPGTTKVAEDTTTRTDSTCRTIAAASPVPLGVGDIAVFSAVIEFPTKSSNSIMLGRASFILEP
jgi:hypothetical protein